MCGLEGREWEAGQEGSEAPKAGRGLHAHANTVALTPPSSSFAVLVNNLALLRFVCLFCQLRKHRFYTRL